MGNAWERPEWRLGLDEFDKLNSPCVLFIGEHHGDPQAKALAAQILSHIRLRGGDAILHLEALDHTQQACWDRYVEGRLSEAALRRELRFDENWGYPWPPYRALLHLCRFSGIRVVALDDRRLEAADRDQAMAARIDRTLQRQPSASQIVLVGAKHLDCHRLPHCWEALAPTVPTLSINTVTSLKPLGWNESKGDDPFRISVALSKVDVQVSTDHLLDEWTRVVRELAPELSLQFLEDVHVLSCPPQNKRLGLRLGWNDRSQREFENDGMAVLPRLIALNAPTQSDLEIAGSRWLRQQGFHQSLKTEHSAPVEVWTQALCQWLHRPDADSLVEAQELLLHEALN